MPLLTGDIAQARAAYAALEHRAAAAEAHAAALQAAIDGRESEAPALERSRALGEFVLAAIIRDAQLEQARTAPQEQADVSLQALVAAIGTALALAEATMPERTIPTASGSVRSSLVVAAGEVGLRLSPADSAGAVTATTAFEIVSVPNSDGRVQPRLFAVLEGKLATYGTPAWSVLPAAPAALAAASRLLATAGSWTFAAVRAGAEELAAAETALAARPPAGARPRAVAAYAAAASALAALASTLRDKPAPVAGDVHALETALAATTAAASTVLG